MGVLQPTDLVDIGIEKEKKRRDFYKLAAEHFTGEEQLVELFTRLAAWEEEHIEKFEEIRESVSGGHNWESYPGELEAYMQAVVESSLYDKVTPELFGELVKTPADAFNVALKFEKDAILFFSGLSKYVTGEISKVTGQLIQEERDHVVQLTMMRKEMGV